MHLNLMHQAAQAMYKRAADGPDNGSGGGDTNIQVKPWFIALFLVDLVVAIFFVLFVEYSLKNLYPVFAIVEDENPPAYEPVALDEPPTAAEDAQNPRGPKPTGGRPVAVSSAVLSVLRLLRSHGGWVANFRGLGCYLLQNFLTGVLMAIFLGALGTPLFTPVATLLASLTLVQVSTAWVHIVMTPKSGRSLFKRFPSFRTAFDATWKPITIYWAANEIRRWIPYGVGALMGINLSFDFKQQPETEAPSNAVYYSKIFVLLVLDVIVALVLVLPAYIVVIRVQASLLPDEEETIVPFDRSFQGKVTTTLVGGKGYATISDAWSTFSKSAWRRLIILYVKITLFADLLGFALFALVMLQYSLVMLSMNNGDGGDL